MPLQITLKTFRMAGEDRQLEEILKVAAAAEPGEAILFPEYGAYTVEGSQKAYAELARIAKGAGVTVMTSLNLPSADLPYADPDVNYNTAFVFSRNGQVYSPQAKITPQSFEMLHLDPSSPAMNVAPFSCLNRITLEQNGRQYSGFFFICSDLYVLQMFGYDELKSDALICPANFGNGAEGSAGDVIDYAVTAGLFKQGYLCNSWQEEKAGRTPLTQRVERTFARGGEPRLFRQEEMDERVRRSSAVYPDNRESGFCNFQDMLKLTLNGTFTVPRSRSLDAGLKVQLGRYEKVIEL